MSIRPDILQDICNIAARQIQDVYPDLEPVFVPHGDGLFHEILELREHDVFRHPAVKIVKHILEKNGGREQSGFLGMAIMHELKWMGLASQENMLALFNLNTDEFKDAKQARRDIYHMLWHAIDLIEVRRRPEYAAKFRSGPMIPKRSPLNLARLNMEADIFSSTMCGLMGEETAINDLALMRAIDSITPVHLRRAEDYPFIIALDAARYAYKQFKSVSPQRGKFITYARQLTLEVGHAFDDKGIKNWWAFSEPAQDMAWRKFSKEFILECAMNTSEDAFVRATGHLVSDITGIIPAINGKSVNTYNAFANIEENGLLHREIMEKTFEDAVAKGVEEESGAPLILAANLQNENLAEGLFLGWCGHALQAAAKAFDTAIKTGASPLQAARLEFEGTKDIPNWETLSKISQSVVEQKRQGYAVTLGNVAEICNNDPLFSPMLGSIRITMKDPNYIQKLEAANDLRLAGPAPSAPAPKGPAPKTPAPEAAPAAYYAPAMPGPSLGLGGSGRRMPIRPAKPPTTVSDSGGGRDEDRP